MVVYFQTYVSSFHECDSILTEKFRKAVDWEYTSEYSVDYPGMYSLYTHEKEKKLLAFCKKHPDYKIAPDLLLQALEIDMDSWNSYYDGNKVVKAPKREVFSRITKINKVIQKLPAEIMNTNLGKKLLERASIAKAVSVCRKTYRNQYGQTQGSSTSSYEICLSNRLHARNIVL